MYVCHSFRGGSATLTSLIYFEFIYNVRTVLIMSILDFTGTSSCRVDRLKEPEDNGDNNIILEL